jgi:release factor glutamine methyltransferase
MWRHLFEERVGAQQRCLDVGSGAGLQTVQLALNGAAHVHAIDVNEQAVTATLENAFHNGVADRVSADITDIFPWVPPERYELVVANLPQLPVDPLSHLSSHRPIDYWGRGLIDQVIGKLPHALAEEGRALLTLTSLISRERTLAVVDQVGLAADVIAVELQDLPEDYRQRTEHLARVEHGSDGYVVNVGDRRALVCYLLEIKRRRDANDHGLSAWTRSR